MRESFLSYCFCSFHSLLPVRFIWLNYWQICKYLLTASTCQVSAGLFFSVKLNYSPRENVVWRKWQNLTGPITIKCASLGIPRSSSLSKEVIPLSPSSSPCFPSYRWVHSSQLACQYVWEIKQTFPGCQSNQKSCPVYCLLNVLYYSCSPGQFWQPCLLVASFPNPSWLSSL